MAHHPRIIRLEPHERTPEADVVGTPAYRARHIAQIWNANRWHEAVMVLAGGGSLCFLFYAIARAI